MKDTLKFSALIVLGLITAILIYPVLHELGHIIAAVLVGAEVREVVILPLPSVLCQIDTTSPISMIMVGVSGMLLPYLITLNKAPKGFWMWYVWLVLKGICILSFVIAGIAVFQYQSGTPMVNEDMTQVMKYAPEYAIIFLLTENQKEYY